MKYKPLILLIPFILILGILFFIDESISDNQASSTTADSSVDDESAKEKGMKLSLVVGKTGSMEGGGEPIYERPDDSSEQIAELQYNCAVLPEKEQDADGWVHVDLIDKGDGYVDEAAVELCNLEVQNDSNARMDVVESAFEYLGLNYKRYGDSLTEGIDCSNYVSQIYKLNDFEVPSTPIGLRDFGIKVDDDKAQVGDLVFYDKANDGDGHVALYLGDGFMINSSGHSGKRYPEGGVRICRLLYADRDSYGIYNIIDPAEVSDGAK